MAPLHFELLQHQEADVRGWLLLTHGIFGSGSNWRSIARKLHRARPDLGCALVDLRNHGKSPAPPGPHDLAACADDLGELVDLLAGRGLRVVAAAGHSFGGKVVAMLRHRRHEHAHVAEIRQWWMLDSSPSPRPGAWTEPRNSVRDVLETLESLPATLATRAQFEGAMRAGGHAESLVQWLALNLEPDSRGALRLRLPLPAVRQMLDAYYAADIWPAVRDPDGGEVRVVVAERSTTLSAEDRAALRACPPHVAADFIAADHWLHIDAPEAVVALLAEHLPAP